MDIAQKRIDDWIKNNHVSALLNFHDLNLTDNMFNDLILPSNLRIFNCSANNLTTLQLNAPNLQQLQCANNNLTTLQLNAPNLQQLHCANNKLITLQLNTPNLLDMYCNNNKLITLQLDIPTLQTLHCNNNELKVLQLNTPNLQNLCFCENNLTMLNFYPLKLDFFSCKDNKYLYIPLFMRKKYDTLDYNINYNQKASIIKKIYRRYKRNCYVKYLDDILYKDINKIIACYLY